MKMASVSGQSWNNYPEMSLQCRTIHLFRKIVWKIKLRLSFITRIESVADDMSCFDVSKYIRKTYNEITAVQRPQTIFMEHYALSELLKVWIYIDAHRRSLHFSNLVLQVLEFLSLSLFKMDNPNKT